MLSTFKGGMASVPSHKIFPAARKEAISKIALERGSWRQWKSAQELRCCEPAFSLDLNLFEKQSAHSAADSDSATSNALDDTDPPGHPVYRQRIVYFQFPCCVVEVPQPGECAGPRIHRPDQAIQVPTITRPVDLSRLPVEFWSVSCQRFILRSPWSRSLQYEPEGYA